MGPVSKTNVHYTYNTGETAWKGKTSCGSRTPPVVRLLQEHLHLWEPREPRPDSSGMVLVNSLGRRVVLLVGASGPWAPGTNLGVPRSAPGSKTVSFSRVGAPADLEDDTGPRDKSAPFYCGAQTGASLVLTSPLVFLSHCSFTLARGVESDMWSFTKVT